jgi:hypothetical protein
MVPEHMIPRNFEGVINGKKSVKTGKVTVDEISQMNHKRQILPIQMLHALTELFFGSRIFPLAPIW